MIVTAWNNGSQNRSGSGYGFKVNRTDRDKYFKREWKTVLVELAGNTNLIKINIDKDGFWIGTCRELICKDIGIWLRNNGLSPWPKGKPPKLLMEHIERNRFRVQKLKAGA